MNANRELIRVRELSDAELESGLQGLLRRGRWLVADVLAHLGEVEERRLHLLAGYGSLFSYCVSRLKMSEDEACRRIDVARLARRFPALFDALAQGRISLSVAALLKPHLTVQNHQQLIEAVTARTVHQAREVLAASFPLPDVAPSIRRLPARRPNSAARAAAPALALDLLAIPANGAPESATSPKLSTVSGNGCTILPPPNTTRAAPTRAANLSITDARDAAAPHQTVGAILSAAGAAEAERLDVGNHAATMSAVAAIVNTPHPIAPCCGAASAENDVATSSATPRGLTRAPTPSPAMQILAAPSPSTSSTQTPSAQAPPAPVATPAPSNRAHSKQPEHVQRSNTLQPTTTPQPSGAASTQTPAPASSPISSRGLPFSRGIEPLSAERYKVQFTASGELKRKLELARDLARHGVPSGDLALLIERAIDALLEQLMKRRFATNERAAKQAAAPDRSAHGNGSTRGRCAGRLHVPASCPDADESGAPGSQPLAPTYNRGECVMGQQTTQTGAATRAGASSLAGHISATHTAAPVKGSRTTSAISPASPASSTPSSLPEVPRPDGAEPSPLVPRTRHVSSHTRRIVLARDEARCTYEGPDGTRCNSRAWLEHDHIVPFALGGTHHPANIRLRCRPHNRLAAEHAYGQATIASIIQRRQTHASSESPA